MKVLLLFAVILQLTLADNNWWIGSPHCSRYGGSNPLICSCSDLHYSRTYNVLFKPGSNNHEFHASLVDGVEHVVSNNATNVVSNNATKWSSTSRRLLQTTMHDNYCDVPGPSEIYHVTENWYSISDGQPYGGISITSYSTIDVKAGRQKTEKVAQAFTRGLGPQNMAVTRSNSANFPQELNFAVSTNTQFRFNALLITCYDFRWAQGSF